MARQSRRLPVEGDPHRRRGVSKLHELRHYFASGLIAAGCDDVTVQRAMGHASATTTLGTCAHLWPTAADKTRAAASSMAMAVLATSLPHIDTQQVSDLGR